MQLRKDVYDTALNEKNQNSVHSKLTSVLKKKKTVSGKTCKKHISDYIKGEKVIFDTFIIYFKITRGEGDLVLISI